MSPLASDLDRAFRAAYNETKTTLNYNPRAFLQMLNSLGALRAAQTLLATERPSDGFTDMWAAGRLDLTVEAIVLRPEFAPLFTPTELAAARRRLADVNYILPTTSTTPAPASVSAPVSAPVPASVPGTLSLESNFDRTLRAAYERIKTHIKYSPQAFLEMLTELGGGVNVARAKLANDQPMAGFANLQATGSGRLDLIVEETVVKPEFASLFTPAELATARRRLAEVNSTSLSQITPTSDLASEKTQATSVATPLVATPVQTIPPPSITATAIRDNSEADEADEMDEADEEQDEAGEEEAEELDDQHGTEIEPEENLGFDTGNTIWRIHIPSEFWEQALKAGVVGIGSPTNSPNQNMKRLKRIRVGDRIVAYLKAGHISGLGVVTRQFYSVKLTDTANYAIFNGKYLRRVDVKWFYAPPQPVDLHGQLQDYDDHAFYTRGKSFHSIRTLTPGTYNALLNLLGIPDYRPDFASYTAPTLSSPPSPDTKPDTHSDTQPVFLPSAWRTLADYAAFSRTLLPTITYTADDLLAHARASVTPPAASVDAAELVEDLQQVRLLTGSNERYSVPPYVHGDPTSLHRLMALAVLAGAADTHYSLPIRTLLLWLPANTAPQPDAAFAPELGTDNRYLLTWYLEAGLLTRTPTGWQCAPDWLAPRTGNDPATRMLNDFVAALHAATTDLADARGPLPLVPDLATRLTELARTVLVDPAIVRRIYRSLIAGHHVILSGPPGTGKTELACTLPTLLWREPPQDFQRVTDNLGTLPVTVRREERQGYLPIVVTATEDWGVRDVVGGIAPVLAGTSEQKTLQYKVQHGHLTRTVLRHYAETNDGQDLPPTPGALTRTDYRDENGQRYRGVWLVIDEFTRAPIDAAFGSLLTTLGGGTLAMLRVPTGADELPVPLPSDFRIIGTLNSFDRHFLNQMSEALKRRFDFIDILPPAPALEAVEHGAALRKALDQLATTKQFDALQATPGGRYRWTGVLEIVADTTNPAHSIVRADDPSAAQALAAFRRLFSVIRLFRQLGTAQAIAVYANLCAARLTDPATDWPTALDGALADSLADQLQVLTRDEQRVLLAYVETAGQPPAFQAKMATLAANLPVGRQSAMLHALHEAHRAGQLPTALISDIHQPSASALAQDLATLCAPDEPLGLSANGLFARRLRELVGERGL